VTALGQLIVGVLLAAATLAVWWHVFRKPNG
jgi:hypothetical protein